MLKTPQYAPWRPDKILYKAQNIGVVDTQIVGNFTIPFYVQKGETMQMIEKDGLVRTPSDHMCIITDFAMTQQA